MNRIKYLIVLILIFFESASYSQVLDGYTDKQSYRAGQVITFFLSGTPHQHSETHLVPGPHGTVITKPVLIASIIFSFERILINSS